jgi:hypothetical protein
MLSQSNINAQENLQFVSKPFKNAATASPTKKKNQFKRGKTPTHPTMYQTLPSIIKSELATYLLMVAEEEQNIEKLR